jgi:hypothetical protein
MKNAKEEEDPGTPVDSEVETRRSRFMFIILFITTPWQPAHWGTLYSARHKHLAGGALKGAYSKI